MADPTVFDIREIIRQKIDQDVASFEGNVKVIKAITLGVDYSNSPAVIGREKYVWVRESGWPGAVHKVFNPDRIPVVVNLPCLIMYSPKQPFRWEVYGTDWAEVYNITGFISQNWGVGVHSPNQEWPDYAPGYDPLSIYPRALMPLRTSPGTSGLLVSIVSHRYVYNGDVKTFLGIADVDLSSYQPVSGVARLVVVYLDKVSNTIKTVAGALKVDGTILPDYPSIPGESIVSAAVRLDGDQTVIVDVDITDLRMHLTDTDALELLLKGIAAVETEIDYTLSNHELRINDISNLYDVPTTMGLIQMLPALRGFWPGSSQISPSSGNYDLTDISGNGQHFVETAQPRIGYDANKGLSYIDFNGTDEVFTLADVAHWDILGTETGVISARRGLIMVAWVYFYNTASTVEYVLSKWYGAGQRSYYLRRNASGYAEFGISDDGTADDSIAGTVAIASAGWHLIVGRFDPSDEVAVFDNGVWYRNTSSIPAAIFNGTADLVMAARDSSGGPTLFMDGRVALSFICAAYVPDEAVTKLWNISRKIFGV